MQEQEKVKDSWGINGNDDKQTNSLEEIKDIVMDTNHYYLLLTGVVYILHSLCEFLAIKNEV